jgi:hypothetical protein
MTVACRLRLILGLCLGLIASGCATTYVGVDAGPHAAAEVPTPAAGAEPGEIRQIGIF